jgi:sugar phosphate isomerase/epimerase
MIRLGGLIDNTHDVQAWIMEIQSLGYSAAFCPELPIEDSVLIASYRDAAKKANIIIAEVGAWSNPLSTDEVTRKKAIQYCQERLAVAELVGARCCVNIAGSLGNTWDGPHSQHFSNATFLLIVDTVREIIDAVQPQNTYYTLEMMPWMLPDNADSYMSLLKAVDRPAFGVHLDPVNIINAPRIYYSTRELLKELFSKLGPWIKSCHAKDIVLRNTLTVHLDEIRPGLGALDYPMYLTLLNELGNDVPLLLEHLPSKLEYLEAANYIRGIASDLKIKM